MVSSSFPQHCPQAPALRRRPRCSAIACALGLVSSESDVFLSSLAFVWADVVAVSRREGLGNDRTVCAQRSAGNAVKQGNSSRPLTHIRGVLVEMAGRETGDGLKRQKGPKQCAGEASIWLAIAAAAEGSPAKACVEAERSNKRPATFYHREGDPCSLEAASVLRSAEPAAAAWMGWARSYSRASIQRQSQVREGGMGAAQGAGRGTRFACNGRRSGRATGLTRPKQHAQFSHWNYFT